MNGLSSHSCLLLVASFGCQFWWPVPLPGSVAGLVDHQGDIPTAKKIQRISRLPATISLTITSLSFSLSCFERSASRSRPPLQPPKQTLLSLSPSVCVLTSRSPVRRSGGLGDGCLRSLVRSIQLQNFGSFFLAF